MATRALYQSDVGSGPLYLPLPGHAAGDTYVLQENLTFPGSGLVIGADNLTIDLNGKTLTYNTDGLQFRYGIAIPPGYLWGDGTWANSDLTTFPTGQGTIIKNGVIRQAVVGTTWPSDGEVPFMSACIRKHGGTTITVFGVTFYTYGRDSLPIQISNTSGLAEIYNNIAYESSQLVSNRGRLRGAIFFHPESDTGYIHAYGNQLYGSPQSGIVVNGSAPTGTNRNLVYENTIEHNARVTNCFGVHIYASTGSSASYPAGVYDNIVTTYEPDPGTENTTFNPAPTGELTRNGRGIGVEGGSIYVDVTGNYIDVMYEPLGPTHNEYEVSADAIKLEGARYTTVRNNTAIAHGCSRVMEEDFDDPGYYIRPQRCFGIALSLAPANDDAWPVLPNYNVIENNTLVSVEEGGQYYSSAYVSAPFEFVNMALGSYNTIQNNDCYSNDRFIYVVSTLAAPGDTSQVVIPDNDFVFDRNTFNFLDATGQPQTNDASYIRYSHGDWSILNPILNDGIDLRGATLGWSYQYNSFDVAYDGEILVKDLSNNPLEGMQISILNAEDVTVFEGITNAEGKALDASGEAPRLKDFYKWIQYDPNVEGITEYNPHTVVLTVGTFQEEKSLTAALNFSETFNYDVGPTVTEVAPNTVYTAVLTNQVCLVKGTNFIDGVTSRLDPTGASSPVVVGTTFIDSETLEIEVDTSDLVSGDEGFFDLSVVFPDATATLIDAIEVRDGDNLSSLTLRPNARGLRTQLTSSSGGANWTNVDEVVADDNDYNSLSVTSIGSIASDYYKLNYVSSVGVGAIRSVTLHHRSWYQQKSIGQDAKVTPFLYVPYHDTFVGDAVDVTSGALPYSEEFAYNPWAERPWLWSDIATMQAAIMMSCYAAVGDVTETRTSQVYVVVSYDPYQKVLETTTAATITPLSATTAYSSTGIVTLLPTGEGTLAGADWTAVDAVTKWGAVADPDLTGYIEVYKNSGTGELASEYLLPTGEVGGTTWVSYPLRYNDDGDNYNQKWSNIGGSGTVVDRLFFDHPANRDDDITEVIMRYRLMTVVGSGSTIDVKAGLTVNGTDYFDTSITTQIGWTTFEKSFSLNPDTSGAWSYEDIDALQGVMSTYQNTPTTVGEVDWTWFQLEVVSGSVVSEQTSSPISFLLSEVPSALSNTRITSVKPFVYARAVNPDTTGTTLDIGTYDETGTGLVPVIDDLPTNFTAYDTEALSPPGTGEWTWSDIAGKELYINADILTEGLDRAIDVAYGGLKISYITITAIEPLDAVGATWSPLVPTVTVSTNDATGAVATGAIEALPVTIGIGGLDVDVTSALLSWDALTPTTGLTVYPSDATATIEPLEVSIGLGGLDRVPEPTSFIIAVNTPSVTYGGIERTGEYAEAIVTPLEVTIGWGSNIDPTAVALTWDALGVTVDVSGMSRDAELAGLTISIPPISAVYLPVINRDLVAPVATIGIPSPTVVYAPDYILSVTKVTATVAPLNPLVSYVPAIVGQQMVYPLTSGGAGTTSLIQTDGINTVNERSFFEYRPTIEYTPPPIAASDMDAMFARELAPQLPTEDSDFIDDVGIYDEKIRELGDLIRAQQMSLRLLVDPLERPDVAAAVEYFRSTPDISIDLGTTSSPVITYGLYDRCYKIIAAAPVTSVGGDIYGTKTKREYEEIAANFVEEEGKKVLLIVSRYILGISCDFMAKVSPPPVKGRLKAWAKRFKKVKISTNMEGEGVTFDVSDGKEEFLNGDSILADAVTSSSGESGYEAIGHASTVLDYTHSRAREGDTPGASPGSFYARPVHEHIVTSNEAARLTTHTGLLSSEAYRTSEKKLKITPKTDEEKELLELAEARKGDKQPSHGYKALRDRGLGSSILAVDDMTAALKTWYEGPEMICCIIDRLGAVGKIDRGLLASMKAFLGYKIGRMRAEGDDVIRMGGVLDSLLMALNGALMSLIDTMMHEVAGELTSAVHLLGNSAATRACTPMDELLSVVQGELLDTNIQLRSIVGTFVSSLDERDKTTRRMAGTIRKTQRLEVFYRLLSAILDSLDNGELCKDTAKEDKPAKPTVEEVRQFMLNRGNPLFEDAQRGRQYIIDKYKRDPVTGAPISEFGGEEDIRQKLQDCGKLQGKDLEDMVDLLSRWRS